MSVQKYLPSAQFAVIVGALFVSGGLVFAAQWVTKHPAAPQLASAQSSDAQSNWQQTLEEIQASSGTVLPQAPSAQEISRLVANAQTGNLTDSVAHTLLIKLADAKAQGLGDDIPTQDSLVAGALAQIGAASSTVYTAQDLTVVPATSASLRAYGNAFMTAGARHDKANASIVLAAVGFALDYQDQSQLEPLAAAASDYQAFARDLIKLPVPETIYPLHLQVINDLAAMGSATLDSEAVLSDPLRGLRGVQQFDALDNEAARVLTTVAQTFAKDGIIFTKDEPGVSWSAFLPTPTQ